MGRARLHRYPSAGRRRVRARPRAAVVGLAALTTAGSLLGTGFLRSQPAWAAWPIGVAGVGGKAQAGGAPAAPTGVSAACGGLVANTITVSWTAVTRATTYTIYQSTTSSSAGYSVAASGVTGTSWTTPALVVAGQTYWFEVAAVTGSYWQGPNSAASNSHSITLALLCV